MIGAFLSSAVVAAVDRSFKMWREFVRLVSHLTRSSMSYHLRMTDLCTSFTHSTLEYRNYEDFGEDFTTHDVESRGSQARHYKSTVEPDVHSIRKALQNRRAREKCKKRLGSSRQAKHVRCTDLHNSSRPNLQGKERKENDGDVAQAGRENLQQQDSEDSSSDSTKRHTSTEPDVSSKIPYRTSLKAARLLSKRSATESAVAIDDLLSDSLGGLELSSVVKESLEAQKKQRAVEDAEKKRQFEEAARLVREEKARREREELLARTGGLRLPKQPLVSPLDSGWMDRVHAMIGSSPREPWPTTREKVTLSGHDFLTVVPPREWLNDEIINGTLGWLDQAINSAAGIKDVKKQTRKCWVTSSFFATQLLSKGVGNTQRAMGRQGVDKSKFLDIENIFIPICQNNHWTLLVVRPREKTIAHMDSLNPRGTARYTSMALSWVENVLGEKFVKCEWRIVHHQAPPQTNGYDCGVHTITNAICIALGLHPVDSYGSEDMPLQRERIAAVLLNEGFKGDFDLEIY